MAYLIEIPLLPFLSFPHTPFLTVIANPATLSTVSKPISGGGQGFCIFFHGRDSIDRHQQLGNRHGQPQGVRSQHHRQRQDQHPADHQSPSHRHDERRPGLHNGLEIIGGEDIQRQQWE